MVFPALRAAPARRGRDGVLRPLLVQPRRGGAGDGFLHRRGIRGIPALLPGVRAHARALRHHLDQVLVQRVSDEEQERRFQARIDDPTRRWKLSPMDLESRTKWVEYSKAKDAMFAHTDTKQSPWYVVNADDKKRARLNCIAHLLSLMPFEDLTPEPIVLPPRQADGGYVRPPIGDQTFVEERY